MIAYRHVLFAILDRNIFDVMSCYCLRLPVVGPTNKGMTRPSIHSTGNFVYKHVDIYFLAGWQARAVVNGNGV